MPKSVVCGGDTYFLADRQRLGAQALLDRPSIGLDTGAVGRFLGFDKTLVVVARKLAIDRQPERRAVVAAAGQPDRELGRGRRSPRTVSTLVAYCSSVSACSSKAASCTSPNMPRVLTLLSTRLSGSDVVRPASSSRRCRDAPAPAARRPGGSCRRAAARAWPCSFSSTVARICSSFFSLSSWIAPSLVSTETRTSFMRWSFDWASACNCRVSASDRSRSDAACRVPCAASVASSDSRTSPCWWSAACAGNRRAW